jgi:hypothetical protein
LRQFDATKQNERSFFFSSDLQILYKKKDPHF